MPTMDTLNKTLPDNSALPDSSHGCPTITMEASSSGQSRVAPIDRLDGAMEHHCPGCGLALRLIVMRETPRELTPEERSAAELRRDVAMAKMATEAGITLPASHPLSAHQT